MKKFDVVDDLMIFEDAHLIARAETAGDAQHILRALKIQDISEWTETDCKMYLDRHHVNCETMIQNNEDLTAYEIIFMGRYVSIHVVHRNELTAMRAACMALQMTKGAGS